MHYYILNLLDIQRKLSEVWTNFCQCHCDVMQFTRDIPKHSLQLSLALTKLTSRAITSHNSTRRFQIAATCYLFYYEEIICIEDDSAALAILFLSLYYI